MKKSESKKKLSISRETIRTLTAQELGEVDGGTYTTTNPPLATRPYTLCVPPPKPM